MSLRQKTLPGGEDRLSQAQPLLVGVSIFCTEWYKYLGWVCNLLHTQMDTSARFSLQVEFQFIYFKKVLIIFT